MVDSKEEGENQGHGMVSEHNDEQEAVNLERHA